MGANPQETRGIPRNRKCGNCRFYEPAPLYRKGWCRNTKLYPPHANHLVDANTIDCEGGFRSRIYWEPLATGQVAPPLASDEQRPITNSNITPIKPITGPIKPITGPAKPIGAPARYADNDVFGARNSEPTADAYQPPLAASDRPTLSVYKHPLADRSFAIKASDDAVRSVNTNPSPINRSSQNPDNPPPPLNTRQPFVSPPSFGEGNNPGGKNNDPTDTGYPSYNPRGSRSYGSTSFNSGSMMPDPVNRNPNSPEPSPRNYGSQPEAPGNFSQAQDQDTADFGPAEAAPTPPPASRRYKPQEPTRPFVAPSPAPTPPSSGYGQVYGDNPDEFEGDEEYNEAAPPYEDQDVTRPYRTPPQSYSPPKPKQAQAWTEQDMPERNQFDDIGDYPERSDDDYTQPSDRDYPTQPGNYGSPYSNGNDKEPIRIQEALPVNNRPRPAYDPRRQAQPAPARFRPVKEDQPAANMPVTRDWRAILREKAPFTQNWNLEGITMNRQILPWAIGVVLVLILAVVLVANIGKKSDTTNPTVPAGTAAANVTIAPTSASGAATTGNGATTGTGANKTTAAGTAGTSATGTTVAATTAAASATKTALVKGTGSTLNMRDTPTTKGKVLATIKDGEKVTIKDGPKDADGITWYQIEYGGQTGWASSAYLAIQS